MHKIRIQLPIRIKYCKTLLNCMYDFISIGSNNVPFPQVQAVSINAKAMQ